MVVNQTDVRLREHCLLSTCGRWLRRLVTRCEFRRLTRFIVRVDRHVARLNLDSLQLWRYNTCLRCWLLQARRVLATVYIRRRQRIKRHSSLRLEINLDVCFRRDRRGPGCLAESRIRVRQIDTESGETGLLANSSNGKVSKGKRNFGARVNASNSKPILQIS